MDGAIECIGAGQHRARQSPFHPLDVLEDAQSARSITLQGRLRRDRFQRQQRDAFPARLLREGVSLLANRLFALRLSGALAHIVFVDALLQGAQRDCRAGWAGHHDLAAQVLDQRLEGQIFDLLERHTLRQLSHI